MDAKSPRKRGSPLAEDEIKQIHRTARIGLIRARENKGLSRPQLAKKMKVSRTFVYNVEMGVRNVGLVVAARWLQALGKRSGLELFREPRG